MDSDLLILEYKIVFISRSGLIQMEGRGQYLCVWKVFYFSPCNVRCIGVMLGLMNLNASLSKCNLLAD